MIPAHRRTAPHISITHLVVMWLYIFILWCLWICYDHLRPRGGYNGWHQKDEKTALWPWFNVPLRVWWHHQSRIDASKWGANSRRKSWCFIWPTMDSRGYLCDDVDNSVLYLSMEVQPTSPPKISVANHENMHYVLLQIPFKCWTSIDGVGFDQSIDWLVLR